MQFQGFFFNTLNFIYFWILAFQRLINLGEIKTCRLKSKHILCNYYFLKDLINVILNSCECTKILSQFKQKDICGCEILF